MTLGHDENRTWDQWLMFIDYSTKASMNTVKVVVKNVPDYSASREKNDLGFLTFDLQTDLTHLFNWNVKQLFLYLTAEYKTPNNQLNQVVLWDKIILRGENSALDFKNMNTKYYFWDDGNGLKANPNVTLTLSWNIIPNAGLLPSIFSSVALEILLITCQEGYIPSDELILEVGEEQYGPPPPSPPPDGSCDTSVTMDSSSVTRLFKVFLKGECDIGVSFSQRQGLLLEWLGGRSLMTSLVLTDISKLTADGFEKSPDKIMYPYAEPYDLQTHVFSSCPSAPKKPWGYCSTSLTRESAEVLKLSRCFFDGSAVPQSTHAVLND
uniref:Signal peptidase complex subunit 3 n=1 Tax=Timema monikensis TaxID=170555 RepID=A0A7R9E0C6_9NEOP|nr:unnamed protein product [Timema monikensis]